MNVPSYIISADWHLRRRTYARRKDLMDDAIYSLRQIIDYQLEHQIPHLALGDLFEDPTPTPEELLQLRELVEKLREANLPLYYVQGQHEFVRECGNVPWMGVFGDDSPCKHIHNKIVQVGNHFVYGLDYTPIDKVQQEFDNIPPVDVLATHQVWRDFISIGTGVNASFSDVPRVRFIYTGDFHKHLVHQAVGKSGQRVDVISPGATYLNKINEDENKFFFVRNTIGTLESIPLKTRHVYRHKVLLDQDLMYVMDQLLPSITYDKTLPDEIQKPIVDIIYSDAVENAWSRLTSKAGDKVHLFLRPLQVKPGVNAPEVSDRSRNTDGLMGHLETIVDKNSDVYKLCSRLLSADDIPSELFAMHQEALKGNVDRRSSTQELQAAS